jgi:hypothetical protein
VIVTIIVVVPSTVVTTIFAVKVKKRKAIPVIGRGGL